MYVSIYLGVYVYVCVRGEVRLSRTNSQKIGTQAKVFGQKARSKSRPEPEQDPRGAGRAKKAECVPIRDSSR